jgi:hypothetical protein
MSNRRITIIEIPLASATQTTKKHIIKVEVYFNAGGMNFGTYETEAKGLYLAAKPVVIEDHGSFQSESSMAFSGIKQLVKPINRFSQKQLDCFNASEEQLITIVAHVVDKGSLTLQGQTEDISNDDVIKSVINEHLGIIANAV